MNILKEICLSWEEAQECYVDRKDWNQCVSSTQAEQRIRKYYWPGLCLKFLFYALLRLRPILL